MVEPSIRDRWFRLQIVVFGLCFLGACTSETGVPQRLTGGDEGQAGPSSPLTERIGFDFFGSSIEQQLADAEAVADCMANEGFEYVAWVPPEATQAGDFVGDSREWASEWGFGASTLLFPAELVAPAKGYGDLDDVEASNPNLEIMQALTPGEFQAYGKALFGTQPSAGLRPSDAGCIAAGVDEDRVRIVNEILSEFEIELASLDARVLAHPTMLEFEEAIRECVEGEGFQWTNRDQAEERFLALASAIGVETDPSPDNKAELVKLQEAEIALALAEYDCGGSASERDLLEATVRAEVERDFIESNSASLDRILEGQDQHARSAGN